MTSSSVRPCVTTLQGPLAPYILNEQAHGMLFNNVGLICLLIIDQRLLGSTFTVYAITRKTLARSAPIISCSLSGLLASVSLHLGFVALFGG